MKNIDKDTSSFNRLLEIMNRLRNECPWDKQQTMESLRHLTIEETYELSEAILSNEINEIKNELGDLLLHIVFYSKIASEKKHFDINILSAVLLTKLISRNMIRSQNPSIINISSVAANQGIASLANYSASKGALKSFTISTARELGPFGVRVNCISPGIIKTKIHKNNKINKFKKNISLERLGSPKEVANVALFLASEYSSYINGQDLKVDGQIKIF